MRRLVRHDSPGDASAATSRPVAIIAVTPNLGKTRAMLATGGMLELKVCGGGC